MLINYVVNVNRTITSLINSGLKLNCFNITLSHRIMFTIKSFLAGLSVSLVLCSINVRRTGWLDRVVEYQKKLFIDDLMKQPLEISATIEIAPPGYVDSKGWDYDSVIRLLTLIRDSEGAAPVRQAFRRTMRANRRFMSFPETFKAFPSLIRDHVNNFHYNIDSGEYYADIGSHEKSGKVIGENDVIVVANPVEAKLPSARISVALLKFCCRCTFGLHSHIKRILETRAAAGRVMPTMQLNISWPVTPKRSPTTKSTTSAGAASSESAANATHGAGDEKSSTVAPDDAASNATAAGNGTAEEKTNKTET